METAVIFNTKKDAVRVNRRLRVFSILSRVCGNEVRIMVTPKFTTESVTELALKIHKESKYGQ